MSPRSLLLTEVLYRLTWLSLIALPIAAILALFVSGAIETQAALAFPSLTISETLPGWRAWFALALGCLPGIAVIWVLWQTQALFAIYRQGGALSHAAAYRIKRIGVGLFTTAALMVSVRILQILVLTSANAPGERVLAISIGTSDIGFALAGGLMALIGSAMAEAARIAEEHKAIV